jgi:hypothetical protein
MDVWHRDLCQIIEKLNEEINYDNTLPQANSLVFPGINFEMVPMEDGNAMVIRRNGERPH